MTVQTHSMCSQQLAVEMFPTFRNEEPPCGCLPHRGLCEQKLDPNEGGWK
jgi:hypothetical protein